MSITAALAPLALASVVATGDMPLLGTTAASTNLSAAHQLILPAAGVNIRVALEGFEMPEASQPFSMPKDVGPIRAQRVRNAPGQLMVVGLDVVHPVVEDPASGPNTYGAFGKEQENGATVGLRHRSRF